MPNNTHVLESITAPARPTGFAGQIRSRFAPAAMGVALMSLIAVSLVGCGGGSDNEPTGLSRVRIINGLIAASGYVDPSLNETALGSRVVLGGITGYKGVSPSGQILQIKRSPEGTGSTPSTNSPTFQQTVQTLERNKSYSLVVAGVVGTTDAATAPQLLVLSEPDVPQAGASSGPDVENGDGAEAAVRLLNLSPDAGAVQLLSGDAPVGSATGVTFGNASPYIPIAIESAKLRVRVAASGTASATDVPVLSDTGVLVLTRGRSYTLVLTGLRAPTTGREGLAVTITPEN